MLRDVGRTRTEAVMQKYRKRNILYLHGTSIHGTPTEPGHVKSSMFLYGSLKQDYGTQTKCPFLLNRRVY